MDIIQELEKVRATLTGTVVTAFDRIIEGLENPSSETEAKWHGKAERTLIRQRSKL